MSRHIVLITGPPGAGKSTKALELAIAGYIHVEREQYADDPSFRAAVETLTRAQPRVAVVRCCFTADELAHWLALTAATEHLELNPGIDVAKARVTRRANADWQSEIAAVDRWYRGRARQTGAGRGRWW